MPRFADLAVLPTWYTAPGVLASSLRIAEVSGHILAAALDGSGNVWTNQFLEGTGNGWQSWTYAGKALNNLAVASSGSVFYLVGTDTANNLWWYASSTGSWNSVANIGAASITAVPTFTLGDTIPYVAGDFDRNGTPDVVWQDPVSGSTQVWLMGGANGTSVIGSVSIPIGAPWHIVAVGDYNLDGHPDLVGQDPSTGQTRVWFLGGADSSQIMGFADITPANPWRVVAAADFDKDGHLDLVWQDPVSGQAQIWYLGGPQGTDVLFATNVAMSNSWKIVGAAEFGYGAGHPGLLWQDPGTGATQIWSLDGSQGTTLFSAYVLGASNPWTVCAIADYNRDGTPDIIWQDPNSGTSQIWLLEPLYPSSGYGALLETDAISGPNAWRIVGPR
jgi:hypothetical protein